MADPEGQFQAVKRHADAALAVERPDASVEHRKFQISEVPEIADKAVSDTIVAAP